MKFNRNLGCKTIYDIHKQNDLVRDLNSTL